MSDTPYADQFVNFQALLDKVGPAYHELHSKSLPRNIDDLRENYHSAIMDVLKEYSRVLGINQKLAKVPLSQSEMSIKAEQRTANFEQLDAETQWMIDKELGILDWDGN
jgi:hypothetical protein